MKTIGIGIGIPFTIPKTTSDTQDTLSFVSNAPSISPSITRVSGAPTPHWTIIESDQNQYIYTTDSFTHTRNTAGNIEIHLAAAALPFITHLDLSNSGLTGTLTHSNFLSHLPSLQELRLYANNELNCNWSLANLPASMTYLQLGYTSSTITGTLADLPTSMIRLYLYNTSSTITGTLADLPASMIHLYLYNTPSTITGSLADLPASMTYLRLYNTPSTITGGTSVITCTNIYDLHLENTNMQQSDIDDCLHRIYTDRALFTTSNHLINIAGTNPPPSGTYQYAANPSTGKEYAYALENDDDSEGFPLWQIISN